MSRKIVFINQATGYLTIDIINEFVKEFEKVALITGSIRVQDVELDTRVKISKVSRYDRGNNRKKALSWVKATTQIFFLLLFKYRKYEIIFFTIPPTVYLIALHFRRLFSIIIYDLYPEALKANGFEENGFLYKFWKNRNRKIFPKTHYSTEADIRVISNWSAFSGYTPVEKSKNSIIKREELDNKFIVQYSGNIGFTHNVETLVDVAELLRNEKDVEFLIIGRGDKKTAIGNLIEEKKLENCRILPFRDDGELYESLCVADLAVVTLDDKTTDISVPSKTYNIFAAGVPVMSISREDSSVAKLISGHNAGKSFEKRQINEMAALIMELKRNKSLWKELANNSLNASESYTSANAAKYLEYYKD